MSAFPLRKLSEEEYLLIEDKAPCKSEFFDGTMFAMAGNSVAHNRIAQNLSIEFGIRMKNSPCQGFQGDMRVKVKLTGLYTYPDYLIVCEEPQLEIIKGVETLLNPKVVFEVLSRSTEMWDRQLKCQHYENLLSMQEYFLIDQYMVRVDHYVRDDMLLKLRNVTFDIHETLTLASIPLSVPIADIYRRVPSLEPAPKPYSGEPQ